MASCGCCVRCEPDSKVPAARGRSYHARRNAGTITRAGASREIGGNMIHRKAAEGATSLKRNDHRLLFSPISRPQRWICGFWDEWISGDRLDERILVG